LSGGELGSSPQKLEFHGPVGPRNSSVNKVVIGCTFTTVWPVFLLTSWAGSATLENKVELESRTKKTLSKIVWVKKNLRSRKEDVKTFLLSRILYPEKNSQKDS